MINRCLRLVYFYLVVCFSVYDLWFSLIVPVLDWKNSLIKLIVLKWNLINFISILDSFNKKTKRW